jgi:hypothetical protein
MSVFGSFSVQSISNAICQCIINTDIGVLEKLHEAMKQFVDGTMTSNQALLFTTIYDENKFVSPSQVLHIYERLQSNNVVKNYIAEYLKTGNLVEAHVNYISSSVREYYIETSPALRMLSNVI